uniref:Uncharacterized protein n=1 Tax=Arundo donax TaxID=35708 RepID=A0A0A8Y938_ARUDO
MTTAGSPLAAWSQVGRGRGPRVKVAGLATK